MLMIERNHDEAMKLAAERQEYYRKFWRDKKFNQEVNKQVYRMRKEIDKEIKNLKSSLLSASGDFGLFCKRQKPGAVRRFIDWITS